MTNELRLINQKMNNGIGTAECYAVGLRDRLEILNKIIRYNIENQGFNHVISCELDD
jgi:hypothetical protein